MEINRINYEKFFLLYLDRELNSAEMQEVEKFLGENTDLQKEFILLQQTLFVPEEIVFEQKELLLKKEEKRKVVPFYRLRVAAAVAALILAGWFVISQGIKNSKAVSTDALTTIANNAKKDPAIMVDKIQSERKSVMADQSNNPSIQRADKNNPANLPAGKEVAEGKRRTNSRKQNDITGPGNKIELAGKQNNSNVSNQETESTLAIQKSSAALEIQSAAMQTGTNPQSVSSQPGNAVPAALTAANPKSTSSGYENAVLNEQDFQSDNAISVVALNDPNKGISKFFKKLTKRAPETESARKIRVSVFQFSY